MGLEKTDPSFQSVASYDFPKLFEILTNRDNGNFKVHIYGEYVTWIWMDDNVPHTFVNFGLINNGFEDFAYNTVVNALQKGYPIFMDGYAPGYGGHAWVCSAALKATVPYTYVPKSQLTHVIPETAVWSNEEKMLLHHNFGWSGNCNGYYYIDMSVNTAKGGILNDNLSPNYNRPPESWGDFDLNNIRVIINRNK